MSSAALSLGRDDNGRPIVLLGERGEAAEMAALLAAAPDLATDAHALAHAANHLARGNDYRVIDDPVAYAAAYRARIAREDPEAEWQAGAVRLRDFGVPDFAEIRAPAVSGGRLTFYAEQSLLGVPYRAETADLRKAPIYTPLPLSPT